MIVKDLPKKNNEFLLVVLLDAWGVGPDYEGNLITQTKTPNFDNLTLGYPSTTVKASGTAVGLDRDESGSSFHSHIVIGSGRPYLNPSNRVKYVINKRAIETNDVLSGLVERLKKYDSNLHFFITKDSFGTIGSKVINNFVEYLRKQGIKKPVLHLESDTVAQLSAKQSKELENNDRYVFAGVSSPSGQINGAHPGLSGVGGRDEFFIFNTSQAELSELSSFLYKKWPDRSTSLFESAYKGQKYCYVAQPSIFPTLDDAFEQSRLRQLRFAAPERLYHVGYAFDGQRNRPSKLKEILVSSSSLADAQKNSIEVQRSMTKQIIKSISLGSFDFGLATFSGADRMIRLGDNPAACALIREIDLSLGKIAKAVIARGGIMLIAGTYGNMENAVDMKTGEADIYPSSNPVPLILVSKNLSGRSLGWTHISGDLSVISPIGSLCDIAPTSLALIGGNSLPAFIGKNLITP